MDKRFQVFVSSTYEDLREERDAVLRGILELGQFPVGMEVFPAADPEPLKLIRPIIEESDFYVLVIAGAYGSTDDSGISFTEREYELAVELGKPVIAFLHAKPDEIAAGKCAMTPSARRKLAAFRSRIEKAHTRKHWTNREELRTSVVLALGHAIRTIPATGWIRADKIDNTALLTKMNEFRDEVDRLRAENDRLKQSVPSGPIEGIAGANDSVSVPIRFSLNSWKDSTTPFIDYTTTWGELFSVISESLLRGIDTLSIEIEISRWIASKVAGTEIVLKLKNAAGEVSRIIQFDRSFIRILRIQFLAWNAITVSVEDSDEVWYATPPWRRLILAKLAIANGSSCNSDVPLE